MNVNSKTLYEQDFYLWLETTIKLLEEGEWQKIDRENLIEELSDMGKSEKRQLNHRLITVLEHLLKLAYWQTEKEYNERGWKNTIIEQRKRIELIFRDSPSLRTQLEFILPECYADAKEITWRKTGLTLPDESPFELEEVLNPDFFLNYNMQKVVRTEEKRDRMMKLNPQTLYEQNFYLWLESTIKLLEEEEWHKIDRENLIEELSDMGKSQKNALKSNLRILLMHLLKYRYELERRSNSWLYTIFEHHKRLQDSLQDSPSLKRYLAEVFEECYQDARKAASLETGLSKDKFPLNSPFSIDEVLDEEFLPS